MNKVFIAGSVYMPGSKSLTLRYLIGALFSNKDLVIGNCNLGCDCLQAIKVLECFGLGIERSSGPCAEVLISHSGNTKHKKDSLRLECRESGFLVRALPPIAMLFSESAVIDASGSLRARPIDFVLDGLSQVGISGRSSGGCPPISLHGSLKAGVVSINTDVSSQFLSGLLFALPNLAEESSIRLSSVNSAPYIALTVQALKTFGVNISHTSDFTEYRVPGGQKYSADNLFVEGDWSSAAYFLVIGAAFGEMLVSNMKADSLQADMAILNVLRAVGAKVEVSDEGVFVKRKDLRSFQYCAEQTPDLVPALVALACFCEGTSTVTGISRLRFKESNRLLALVTEFSKLGAKIESLEDELRIQGGNRLVGCRLDSWNDHRIAMALYSASPGFSGSFKVEGIECIQKSYPDFIRTFSTLTVER